MNGLLPHRTLSMCSSSYNRYYSFLRIRRIAPLPPPPITLAPLVSARFHIQSSTHVYIHFFWLASFDSRFCFTVSSHFYLFHSLSFDYNHIFLPQPAAVAVAHTSLAGCFVRWSPRLLPSSALLPFVPPYKQPPPTRRSTPGGVVMLACCLQQRLLLYVGEHVSKCPHC